LSVNVVQHAVHDYLRSHKWLVTFCLSSAFLALWCLWPVAAPIRGGLAARFDVKRGQYQLLGYGLPARERPAFARCLQERYAIEFLPVAGCMVSESLVSYVNAYNSVIEKDARHRLGHDVFQECANEALSKWTAQHTAATAETSR
jgi:hypothetical protein